MNHRVVLDACVLVPYNLTSLLLTLAEANLYAPRWSHTILDETHRALTTKIGVDDNHATKRLHAMRAAFPEADVIGYEALIDDLTCHPKDRHVLAAAITSDADTILTFNTSDFPQDACRPHGVTATHPDTYLTALLTTDPTAVIAAFTKDAARRTTPPATTTSLLTQLGRTVPAFASRADRLLADHPHTPARHTPADGNQNS